MKLKYNTTRPKCKIIGCGCLVDFWLGADKIIRYSKLCQKHRKIQPRQRRILDDCIQKPQMEFRNGKPLCMVENCHRVALSRGNKRKRGKICEYHARSYHKHQERLIQKRYQARLSRYGITKSQYESMLSKQNGLCAICGTKPAIAVDHNHITGKIRGLLCVECNLGIGHFKENKHWLFKAIQYLNYHN